ncbi:MAG: aspartyl-phosphate phosphatase Spo0E family protein [Maledivibacter sp.]|jgi:hypothetical protein|nr:aspartyl-phosphate phosphatase Spo0E family protein [Maledivibacter sp.]
MSKLDKEMKLVEKINLLRRRLEEYLSMTDKPTDNKVVRVSQELDELLVAYYRLMEGKCMGTVPKHARKFSVFGGCPHVTF